MTKNKYLAQTTVWPLGLTFALMLFFSSCQLNQEEVERLRAENEQLKGQVDSHFGDVETYMATLNAIEENLAEIKKRENIISVETSGDIELRPGQQDRINSDIRQIGELMEKNRQLIAQLNRNMRNANVRIGEFEKMVANLTQRLQDKELEIQILKDELARMNLRVDYLSAYVDTLERLNVERDRALRIQADEVNTAYFVIGTRRELRENDIISREGGFLGIGKSNRLKPGFSESYFTRIDIRRDKTITILGKDPRLVTSHPQESYELIPEGEIMNLQIKNETRFWSASRYLVIEIR